ncbi:MAG: FAD-binding oxidoreductase, partial [Rhodospirillaceae bacterium]|nr:FAD-binding oxidoreductase [Rhodospirillaceae bacterium]
GGIVGCAAAYEAARAGMKTVLVEKGRIGGEQSSRNLGFVRQQGRDPFELPLMRACMDLWKGLEAELGADLGWRQGGNIALAGTDEAMARFAAWLPDATAAGIDSRLLNPAEAAALLPGFEGRTHGALYTPSDGQAEPDLVAPAFAEAARKRGAEILTGCAVRALAIEGGRVAGVVTERGILRAPIVICAAGAWSSLFLGNHGLRLPQIGIELAAVRTRPTNLSEIPALYSPAVAFRRDSAGRLIGAVGTDYTYHLRPETLRFAREFAPLYRKSWRGARIRLGRPFLESLKQPRRWSADRPSPFEAERVLDPTPDRAESLRLLDGIRAQFPQLGALSIESSWAGRIDMTPDLIPVIGPVAALPGLLVASGFSSHGFAMGPIVGKLLAELAGGGEPSLDLSAFRFERFAEGASLGPRNAM